MRPPRAWMAASLSLSPALILRDSRCGLRLTGKPPGLHVLDVRRAGCGFLGLRGGIGLRLLLRPLARMHHHKAERFECDPSVALLDLHLPDPPLSMPTPRGLVLRPPRLLQYEGQGGLLRPPGCDGLADGTRARDSRDEGDLRRETPAQRAATLGLTL